MKVDFTKGRLTVVIAPIDLRAGYKRLSLLAQAILGIAVEDGNQYVAFVSRDRNLCKVIWCDESGSCVLTRRLHQGRFERFLVRVNEPDIKKALKPKDFMDFLDGKPLFKKSNPLYI